MESKPKKEPIKIVNIPKDANLTDYITLEEENNRLREERDILLERKTDERVATETIARLRKENEFLKKKLKTLQKQNLDLIQGMGRIR